MIGIVLILLVLAIFLFLGWDIDRRDQDYHERHTPEYIGANKWRNPSQCNSCSRTDCDGCGHARGN